MKKMRSGFEKKIDDQLRSAEVPYTYEAARLVYYIAGSYLPDFVLGTSKKVLTKDECCGKIILEVKGHLDVDTRKKMRAVKEENPTLDIRFVLQQNGFVYKNKKGKPRRAPTSTDMRYSDWCEKYGFKWCIGEVPDVWIKEIKKTSNRK